MSKKFNRRPRVGQEIAAVSLAALIACALAGDALASRSLTEPGTREPELSERPGTLVERINLTAPMLGRELAPERTIVLAQARCFIHPHYGRWVCI